MPTDKIAKKYKLGHLEMNIVVRGEEEELYDRAMANANGILQEWQLKLAKQGVDYKYGYTILELAVMLEKALDAQKDRDEKINTTNQNIQAFLKAME